MANFDYDLENASIERKRKLAEALMLQSREALPQQTAGGFVVPHSWTQGLSKIAGALLSRKDQSVLDQQQKDLMARRQADVGSQMEGFFRTSEGDPSISSDQGPIQPIPADPKKAALTALGSNLPEIQNLGKAAMAERVKQSLSVKDLLSHATPESAQLMVQTGNPALFKPKRELMESGGVVFDKNAPESVVKVGSGAPERVTIAGDLYERNPSTGALRKLDNGTKVNVTNNTSVVNKAQKAGLEQFYKDASAQVAELGKASQSAGKLQQSLAELKALDSSGIYSNVTSSTASFVTNLAQATGMKLDPSVVKRLGNTEAYNAVAIEVWQNLVSKYGGNRGVTAAEAEQIKRILPMAQNSPEARQQIFQILEKGASLANAQYQTARKAFGESVLAEDPKLFIEGTANIFNPEPNQADPAMGQKAPDPALESALSKYPPRK